jgi:hypothetical protein
MIASTSYSVRLPLANSYVFAVRGVFFIGVLALIAEASLAVKTLLSSYKRNKRMQSTAGRDSTDSSVTASAETPSTEPPLHPLEKQYQAAHPKPPINPSTKPQTSPPNESSRADPKSAAAASALQRNPSPPPIPPAATTAASSKQSASSSSLGGSLSSPSAPDTTTTQDREQLFISRRRSAIEALQQQLNEDAERAQKAEQEKQQQKREETLRRLDEQLATVQAGRSDTGDTPHAPELQAALDALMAARAAAANMAADRQLRQEQDDEYEESLKADQAKAATASAPPPAAGGGGTAAGLTASASGTKLAEQQQQQPTEEQLESLQQLKSTLQESLSPEPEPSTPYVVTLRVRLPGGVAATRRFLPLDPFGAVEAWVQGLEGMPLWSPGSWRLASSYPRVVLTAKADGVVVAEWKAGAGVGGAGPLGHDQQQEEQQGKGQRGGEDGALEAGEIAVREGAGGEATAAAAAAAAAAGGGGEEKGSIAGSSGGTAGDGVGGVMVGGSEVAVVGSVQEVQQLVADGASQLALFVMQL